MVIEEVIRCLRKGGEFAFTVYGRRPWTRLNGKYVARHITSRIPAPELLKLVERVMPWVFPVADVVFDLPVLGKVGRFLAPFATYTTRERPGWTREQRYQEAVLDTFDMLAPRYDSPMTWREVDAVIRRAGAASWHFQTKIPVNVVGVR
jgi:hypothetical protein